MKSSLNSSLVKKIMELGQSCPDKAAVCFKKETVTYGQLAAAAFRMADILRENGIRRGDKVCFSAVSKPEMVTTYLAVHILGAVAVFLDKNGTPANLAEVYSISDAKLLLTDKPMKEYEEKCNKLSLKEIYRQSTESDCNPEEEEYRIPEEDDISELLFTSGTTAAPKGVILSHRAVLNILQNTIEGIGITKDTVLLLPLPLHHSFALRVLRAVLYSGGTIVLQNGFTFANEVENNIRNFACNAMACVPASYEVLKSQMQDKFPAILGGLSYIEFGAGSLSIRQRREITELLPNVTIYNTWGSSESGGAIFCNVTEAVKSVETIGALGRPLTGKVDIKIVDEEGRTIESDMAHPGRMVLRGAMQMSGYWKNPQTTADTLVDGWLYTGDLAYLKDGYVFMLGRADDIINVGGEKVSPIEVENIAGQYEYIRECACIGVTDPKGVLGSVPVLFIVTAGGYDEKAFRKYLAGNMEKYKIPQLLLEIEKIPRNRMQKIDRRELTRIYENKGDASLLNPVVKTILARRSIRKFTEKEIPRDILELLLKCGYYAPSGHNMQTWRFTVLTDREKIDALREDTRISAEKEKVHFYGWENPSALILISNDVRNADGCQDASCAAENIMIAANSFGLGACWLNPLMTLRHTEPVSEKLTEMGIPENHTVWAAVALGYPVSDGQLLKKKESVVHFID